MINLSLRNMVRNKAVPRKLNKSAFSALCHMALPQTHPLWAHWRLVAPWGRLSANLFCAVNNDEEGVGLIRFYSTSCYGTLNKEPGECLLVSALWKKTRQGDWQPAKAEHKTQVWRQEWKRVSGEELGWAFYHRAIIHSLVNTEEKPSTNILTALCRHNQSWKKGFCSSHQGQLV